MIKPEHSKLFDKWVIHRGENVHLYFGGFRDSRKQQWTKSLVFAKKFNTESEARSFMENRGVGIKLPNPDNC